MTPDRLSLIERRWREAGCGDGDLAWLLEEVKRLRVMLESHAPEGHNATNEQFVALRFRAERERRHGEWAMRKVRRMRVLSEQTLRDSLGLVARMGIAEARVREAWWDGFGEGTERAEVNQERHAQARNALYEFERVETANKEEEHVRLHRE